MFCICSYVISTGVGFVVVKLTNVDRDGQWIVMTGSGVEFFSVL